MLRDARRKTALLLAAVLLAASTRALALPIVDYTTTNLGGGLFQYDLVVDNAGGGEPLSGLNVLHAGSVFGLDELAAVGRPAGWSSFAPLPPLIDDLNYFSLAPATDIPIGGTRSGFSFQSSTDPSTLSGDEFAVEGIGADSASQIDLGVAVPLPEPSAAALLAAGLAGMGAWRRTRRAV
jgi:hypothetical protein